MAERGYLNHSVTVSDVEQLLRYRLNNIPELENLIEALKSLPQSAYAAETTCEHCSFASEVDEGYYRCTNICNEGCKQLRGANDFCSYGCARVTAHISNSAALSFPQWLKTKSPTYVYLCDKEELQSYYQYYLKRHEEVD